MYFRTLSSFKASKRYQTCPLILMDVSSTKRISPEMGVAHASFTSTELLTDIIISFTIVDAYKLEQLKV
ncbi:MAG: hypothetical protein ACTSYZ_11100 [Candidatus Helarchaeota archaeon]